MSSIQERLQLKRVPLDTWNIREQLCLASAVVRSGDQNWMSVSRALKTVGEANRPPDWYSQKSCAAQYGALLEHVETPKRKKRSSEGAVETPQESILKRLTQERIVEIQKTVAEMNQQYEQLKNEINEARSPATSDDRLREIWTEIETAKRARERENARRAAWLKEREERRARAERTWRPPHAPHASPPAAQTGTSAPSPAPPSSPLLTSLLKSSPVVTTPQHISHPANVVETVSPSAGAPTLSMLLEKSGNTGTAGNTSPHDNKHAAIEHIKSQLVQIEQQLKANTAPPPVSLPAPAPSVDIDDIEIKAEDVYAFRDIDIHIPPVTALHKPARIEKPVTLQKKEEQEILAPIVAEEDTPHMVEEIDVKPVVPESVLEQMMPDDVQTVAPPQTEAPPPAPEPEVTSSSTPLLIEMRFPPPEIKVVGAEEKIKEEVKEVEVPAPIEEKEQEVNIEDETPVVEEQSVQPPLPPEPSPEPVEPLPPIAEDLATVPTTPTVEDQPDPGDIPLPETKPEEIPLPSAEDTPTAAVEDQPDPGNDLLLETKLLEIPLPRDPPLPSEPESQPEPEKTVEIEIQEVKIEVELTEQRTEEKIEVGEVKKEDDGEEEDSIPLKEIIREESARKAEAETVVKEEPSAEVEETHNETDDDTPMELSREEEKDGKKKRDYSRKKKPDSRTCSGSESAAEASAPESPGAGSSTDAERQHRLWKKSVMLVYSRLCAHKYASIFLRPISDEEAPGYSLVVKRPMDLTTIRRNIEAGVIRTTAEFQRDVLQMLSNALMYNSSSHSVYHMAKEMFEEAQCQLGMLVAAQAHAGLVPPLPAAAPPAPPRRKRRRADSPAAPSPAPHTPHAHKRSSLAN